MIEEKIKEVEQHGFKVISNGEWNKFWELLFNYKNAWEELREDNQLPIPFIELLSELMQNLEEKYGIEAIHLY